MKKKLLLSSVAALTLFAAYNTSSAAESSVYDVFNPAAKPKNLLEAVKEAEEFGKVDLDAINRESALLQRRQQAVNVLRDANQKVKDAEQAVEDSEKEYKFYLAELEKAANALSEAESKAKDAKVLKEKLEVIKHNNLGKLAQDRAEHARVEQEVKELHQAQKNLATELAGAKTDVKSHDAKKPIEGTPAVKVAEYEARKLQLETHVTNVETQKTIVDRKTTAKEKKLAELAKDIETEEQRDADLDLAIARLTKIAGSLEDLNPDSDENSLNSTLNRTNPALTPEEVVLKALQTLRNNVKEIQAKLNEAIDARALAKTDLKNAKVYYEEKLEAAKREFAEQKVAFNLDEALAVDTPSTVFVKSFGWNKDEAGNWTYVLDSKGKLAEGWVNDAGSWYYLDPATHVMKKWWVQVEGTWYYLNGSGVMQTGWLNDNGTWYYLEASGAMKANQWFEVDGKWYHVDASGALSVNTTVDGYNVNENGEWV